MAQQRNRRKRKRQGAKRGGHSPAEMARVAEERNRAARESLQPLAHGERPGVVTLGAAISACLAASIVIAYAAGAEVDGERPALLSVVVPAALMSLMAWGMWRARYWAVLGFQALLLILIIATALGLVRATEATQVVGNLAVLATAGTMFGFMVKALARIQMPERRPSE